MIMLVSALKEHKAGYKSRCNVLVQALCPIVFPHVFQHKFEIIIHAIHYQSPVVTVFVQDIQLFVSDYPVKIGHIAKDMHQPAIFEPTEKAGHGHPVIERSEEHTSELQSLMRNSYAVFCLKKKKRHQETTN